VGYVVNGIMCGGRRTRHLGRGVEHLTDVVALPPGSQIICIYYMKIKIVEIGSRKKHFLVRGSIQDFQAVLFNIFSMFEVTFLQGKVPEKKIRSSIASQGRGRGGSRGRGCDMISYDIISYDIM